MIRRPPRCTRTDTLFPYQTLFRSADVVDRLDAAHGMGNDVRIAEVANDHLDIVAMASRRWRAPDQDPDGRPAGPERLQQGASEEPRSEEHTSELQSLMRISYAVFCLKKKN